MRNMAKNVPPWRESMTAIYVLWLRQVKRYSRSRPRIIASLGQPMLFLLAFGFGFGPIFQKAGQGNYIQFLAPGVIAMTVLFTSIFSGIELIWDRQFGFLKETLVAPVPRILIMIGRTLGGATVSLRRVSSWSLICLIAGFRTNNFAKLPLAFIFLALIAIMFTALGTAIASVLVRFPGLSVNHEFSGNADLLSIRRAVPSEWPAEGVEHSGVHRSADLRRGWLAQFPDRRRPLQFCDGSRRAVGSYGCLSCARKLPFLEDTAVTL